MRTVLNHEKFVSALLLVLGCIFLNLTAEAAQTFNSAAGDVNIPDGAAAPLCTTPGAFVCKSILVTGLPGSAVLRSATIVLAGDDNIGSLDAEVRSPTGSPSFLLFSRTGAVTNTDCGDTTDAAGTYVFADSVLGNWWTTAAALSGTDIMPGGDYFPSFPGGASPTGGNPNNTMSATFSGVTNGTWNVCVRDWGNNGNARLQLARLIFVDPATAAAVSISGRIMTAGGTGIGNAVVSLSGGDLTEPLITRTSSFGYYRFENVPAGGTYIVTVSAKRYTFNNPSQVFNVQDNIADANFVAEEK